MQGFRSHSEGGGGVGLQYMLRVAGPDHYRLRPRGKRKKLKAVTGKKDPEREKL